jgi:Ca2+-binding RTX toxin-like protein
LAEPLELASRAFVHSPKQSRGIERMARINGNSNRNYLRGTTSADSIYGYGGDDEITAGSGNDYVSGGAGRDVIYGGLGNDTINGGADADEISGGDGADRLYGDGGNDTLRGGAGTDVLVGGAGSNRLFGGVGGDTFGFLSTTIDNTTGGNATADSIEDFSRSQADIIDVSAIDANSGVAGNQAFKWIGRGEFTGVAGQARYDYYPDWGSTGDSLAVAKFDVNGDGESDLSIFIYNPGGSLYANDFLL